MLENKIYLKLSRACSEHDWEKFIEFQFDHNLNLQYGRCRLILKVRKLRHIYNKIQSLFIRGVLLAFSIISWNAFDEKTMI